MPVRKLVNSSHLYKVVFDSIHEAVSILDTEYRILGANGAFLAELGFEESEVVGRKCYEVTHKRDLPCEGPEEKCPLLETMSTGGHSTAEHIHYGKGGEIHYVEVSTSPIKDEDGNLVYAVHISRDVTERRRSEERIKASLEEKEVLLKEIHHRVKNNLQVISSLLNLQSSYFSDDAAHRMFRDSQNRIKSMALMHEQLYCSGDMAMVDFKGYVDGLLKGLVRSYGMPPGVTLDVDIGDVSFGMDTAIPCGLIINELLSNALKHAFPAGKRGRVDVSLHPADAGGYELVVKDTGVGLPEDLDFREAGTLGLRLVRTLAEGQLEGSVEMKTNGGTEVRVRFMEQHYRKPR